MHKRIVEAIEDALNKDSTHKVLKFKRYPNKEGGNAFWKLKITVKVGYSHLIPNIKDVGLGIGRFYGEGLGVVQTRHTILFS